MGQSVYLLRATGKEEGVRPAPAPAGPAQSSRLDRRTNCGGVSKPSGPHWVLCVRDYSKVAGSVQLGWSHVGARGKAGERGKGNREENEKRALGRAKANMKRDLLEIGADRMLTLTYRENMTDREKAKKDLQEFERRVRRCYPGWRGVGTWEAQERGALHCHMGIAGFYDVKVLRRLWRRTVGEGNIDIAFKPNGRGNAFTKVANYITKYIAKDVENGRTFGQHRYHRSRDIERRCERFTYPVRHDVAFAAVQIGSHLLGPGAAVWTSIHDSVKSFGYLEMEQPHLQPGGV